MITCSRRQLMVGGLLLIVVSTWVTPTALVAQDAPDSVTARIDQIIEETFRADQPGAAIIAMKDGKQVYKSARGMANLELAVPLQPDMVFRLGSITKQFTAAAIMLLVEEGKVSLDDEITRFLPDYPTQGTTITVEQLLNHTSGIRSYTGMPGWMQTRIVEELTVEKLIDGFKNEPMDFQPGSEYRYNNSGYVLLGAIIEKASGKSYAEFIQEKIFGPLEMEHSFYGDHATIIMNRTEGYDGLPSAPQNAKYLSMSQPYAAGSLLSNVADLAKWNAALFGGKVVSAESLELMTTKGQLKNGTEIDYGFGLVPGDIRGHRSIAHGGGIFGFSTFAVYLPDDEIYVAIFCNSSAFNPGTPATKIAALLAGDPFPEFKAVELQEESLQQYVGVYKINETDRRYVTVKDGQLYTQRSGGGLLAATPHSESGFFYETSPSHFEFEVDGEGNITGMNMYQGGSKQPEFAARVDESMPAERQIVEIDFALYDDYTGEYELAPGISMTISRDGDRLMSQVTGQSSVEIFPASEIRFFPREVDATITFMRAENGKVDRIVIDQAGNEVQGTRK